MARGRPGPAFLLLLCSLQAGAAVPTQEVRALVGSDVELNCTCPQGGGFDLDDLYVYWQTSAAGGPEEEVAFHLGNGSRGVGPQYRQRAHLAPERMQGGDFSLSLRRVSPQDDQTFRCLVFRKSLDMSPIAEAVVSLHVAANYSMPVVHAPQGPAQDEVLTFTCTSSNGYPKPNVYWINTTDNSLLDKALQNSSVTQNAQGLYDVVSVLRLGRTANVDVGCCIENVVLRQNLTVSSRADVPVAEGSHLTTGQPLAPRGGPSTLTVLAMTALAVALAAGVALGYMCRTRWLRGRYAGAQAAQPELGLAGHA
ncbi:ICOS ligand [Talpa occidentalis]|uniref:ICOS ligand n=1 Tax=Talpa occidentalis TaxID=50954 RepID=UPI00188F1147|nr:ICOS ligand [Talpa occidentalis]